MQMLFPQYFWYALTDFLQTFVASTSWDKDEPVSFWDVMVVGQRHTELDAVRQI